MKTVLQDAFDGELSEELKDLYVSKVWSEVSENLKDKMKETLKNNLLSCNMEVSHTVIQWMYS